MPDWIGKTIGKVRIEKYLARGGMAEVYLGTHLTLDRPVAIKLLHSYIEEDPDLLVRFQREAKVVAGLRHPNIVQIYDFDTIDGHPYIVMEYLKGPPLGTYLRELHKRNERIELHQVARLLKVLTNSLDYAHEQGMIHRDIKPANILLHGKADEIPLDQPLTSDVEAVLTDFGLVRIANTASQTASGMVSGTPAYMSPEQARGDKTDHRTDIYSLGIVLYEMLAGRVPFEADSTLSVMYKQINDPPPPIPGIAPAVQKMIDRALAKNPEDRYPTSRNMAVDFFLAIGMNAEAETIINTLPVEAKTIHTTHSESSAKNLKTVVDLRPTEKKSSKLGIGVVAVAGLLTLAIGAYFGNYALIYFGIALVFFFSVIPAFFISEPKLLTGNTENLKDNKRSPSQLNQLYRIYIAHGFCWLGIQTMFVYMFFYVKESMGIASDIEAGQVVSLAFLVLNTVGFILPATVLEPLAKKTGRVKVHVLAIAFMAFGYLFITLFGSSVMLIYIFMGIVGIGWAATVSLPFAIMTEKVDKSKMGLFMGIFNLSVVIPQLIVSLGFGSFIQAADNKNIIFIICTVCLAISTVLWSQVKEDKVDTDSQNNIQPSQSH